MSALRSFKCLMLFYLASMAILSSLLFYPSTKRGQWERKAQTLDLKPIRLQKPNLLVWTWTITKSNKWMDGWTDIKEENKCMWTNASCISMLSLGWRMLVRDEPHTSAMDLSQTASSFARLCYPHGNYYLVTFLRSVVGGRRSLPCWDSNKASLFLWLLKINVQYWTRLYI